MNLQLLRSVGVYALRRWQLFTFAALGLLIAASLWGRFASDLRPALQWPITELIGAPLLVSLGFLWAPLLAEPRILRKTIFRRLVPLPNLVIALLAATMLLLWASAALLLVHGAADLLRVSATR